MRGSGVGYGGGNYHLGSGDALDALNSGGYHHHHRDRSGSEGDREEESPPPGHRGGLPLSALSSNNPSNSLGIGHHPSSHSHHQQSLRRSRSRPSPVIYQSPSGLVGHSSTGAPPQENPYQQPYLPGRSAGLSDSPTSDNGSADTLTDSELPFANPNSALPLQNGGLLIGGNLDFTGNSARLNSLKRPLNSNGKSTTGIGHNHDTLIDQFVMHTPGGKIYIPSDTPKNSSSDYKTSPGSSPSKKTSGTLLYKEGVGMGTLRGPPGDPRQRSKADEDDLLYKVRGFCTWKRAGVAAALILLVISIIFNILYGASVLPWGYEGAKNCQEGLIPTEDSYTRQSPSNGTVVSSHHPPPSHRTPPTPSAPDVQLDCLVFSGVSAVDLGLSLYKNNWWAVSSPSSGAFSKKTKRSIISQISPSAIMHESYRMTTTTTPNNHSSRDNQDEQVKKLKQEIALTTPTDESTIKPSSYFSLHPTSISPADKPVINNIATAETAEEKPNLDYDTGAEHSNNLKNSSDDINKKDELPQADQSVSDPNVVVLESLNSKYDKAYLEKTLYKKEDDDNNVSLEKNEERGDHLPPSDNSMIDEGLLGFSLKPNYTLGAASTASTPTSVLASSSRGSISTTTSSSLSQSTPTPSSSTPSLTLAEEEEVRTESIIDRNQSLTLMMTTYPEEKGDLSLLSVENELITSTSPATTFHPPKGGVCECYCPCMDNSLGIDYPEGDDDKVQAGQGNWASSGYGSGHLQNLDQSSVEENGSGILEDESSGSGSGASEITVGNLHNDHIASTTSSNPTVNEIGASQDGNEGDESSHFPKVEDDADSDLTDENYIPVFPGIYKPSKPDQGHQSESNSLFNCSCPTLQPSLPSWWQWHNTTVVTAAGGKYPGVNYPLDGTSFVQITIPTRLSHVIGPYSYWNMQFYQSEGAYVNWEFSVPRGASIGFYARRNALPSHTHYDFMQILRGFKTRTTRSSPPSVSKELSNFLEAGHWFLSLYNDDSDPQEVVFVSNISEEMTEGCPNGCSGNGQCQSGHCQCNPGFGADDCSQSVCPVLCSGRGEYLNGECQCNPGWKGKECSLRHDECEISDCHAHGKCVNGKCACIPGYKGEFCQEADCPHPTCNAHGVCLNGTCMCKKGWRGLDCAQPDKGALQCLPDCSSHGQFNLDTQTCTCEPRWTGEDCSQELCDKNCGLFGICIGGGCQCSEGWTGSLCNQRLCDKRCGEHGQCKNGTCLCVTGWNGKHCTLEGCPNSCSGHGQCKANMEGLWECKCHSGWTGMECAVMMEQNCNDAKDNDKDGLTDCEDPECCGTPQCDKSQLCVAAKKPIDILLRKQPPAITASFFEKMKFLIEEGSLQNYARQDAFNGSRSGVVRGRVVTPNGSGLMGVRVSSSSPLEPLGGFTLTQEDGWFDLMVNGGGAVTLQFGRSPFNSLTRTIFVPWNEVVIIDTVVMGSSDPVLVPSQSCESHDYEAMRPVVLATWKHGFQGDCPGTSAILIESQVVQESMRVPGTGIHLMYHSSRVSGYLSTIQLQLTPENIPTTLKRVHLRITIEGVLFEKTFEADPDIKYTYAWNRLNVYRQRVYGVTTAIVKVGFEYENCGQVIWDVQSTTLSGHDMSISDIGGWNLDIHHRYNFHEGIIQKGDGSNIYLKHRPRVIIPTMGNGYQRGLDCHLECNGVASKQKLLAPVALAAAPDGTLFVGDFNLIRRILVDGTVHTIVKLNATRVSYRYHMALSPVDNTLYISDPESHQIIRVRNVEDFSDPEHNWEPVVGSGERCLPGDEAHCGDEALARDAKLAYPKGVAVSSDNVLFFADGTNIRKVDRDGIITTVIGNQQQKSHWKPIPCEGTLKVEEVHLRWPTELAINPVDNSLYIIDDHMILKLTRDNRLRIIAGRPFHCPIPVGGYDIDLAIHTALISPQSITFASNGDLYVAESDSQRINRVRLVTTDGKVTHFAGAESKCNCLDRGCPCYEEDHYLAATSKFNTISAIGMAPDGILHIADQGNYRIRSVMALIPQPTQGESRQYEIYSPETQEIYIFNRFGQHVATKNIVTGETIYTFLYNVNMSNGKLSSVTDAAGNKIQILRDYSSQVKTIENAQAQKFNLRMSRVRMLQEFSSPEGYNFTFDYHGSTGLIKSRQDSSGRASVYSYDEFGRLTMTVSPTGQVISLNFDLNKKGASVRVTRDDNTPEVYFIKGSSVFKRVGKWEQVISILQDGSVIVLNPWGQVVTTESVPYNLLGEISPALSDSFPVPGKQKTELGGDLVNRVEWRYVGRKEGRGKNKQVVQVDKKFRINGDNVLMIEYDRESKSELIFIDDRHAILNVTYDKTGRPLKWTPREGYAPVEVEHDRFGRLVGWKWDQLMETYEYDRAGRLSKIRYADGTTLTLTFKDLLATLPTNMTTGGGSDYLLEYDSAGAFKSITTPRGHIHSFGVSTSIGVYEYQYRAPSSRDMYKIQYNDLGEVVSIVYPQGSGRVNYVYNRQGKLEVCVAGLRSTRFNYQESTGLLKVAEVSQSGFDLKTEYKYHGGALKEQREKYGSKSGLDNVHLKYQYDGNGRVTTVETEVNGKSIQSYTVKRNQNTGNFEAIGDLKIYATPHHFNRTIIEDSSKSFFKTSDKDPVGRLREILMIIKGTEVFKLNIKYDARGKVQHLKLDIRGSAYAENVGYDEDGHVSEVKGSGHWKYMYDENGNGIQVVEQGEKSVLIYDSGDRVIQVGELLRYTYDSRGFLVQRGAEKFQYDDKGHLIHAVKKDDYKVWFFYDHLDRLISWRDDRGNVTQFVYADPQTPHLLTHIHYPSTGSNLLLLYDGQNNLVSIVTSDLHRYYVGTDQNGSPLAVFTSHGNLVKEVHRSPFGKVVRDSAPEFYLPIDFHGGIVDKHTGILLINGRPYDPTIGQWMVPKWQSLTSQFKRPTDIFTYRFANNDPITPVHDSVESRMTTLDSWLRLYGYKMERIFGQDYAKPPAVGSLVDSTEGHLTPEFGVVSGLECMAQTVTSGFKTVGFSRESKLSPERVFSWSLIPRIAYKRSGFGPGLLVSRMENGRALVSTVDNSVVQGVITSVLNGSIFIDFRSTHQNTFYFVKDNPHKLRDDMEELKRLGELFNISIHDAENGIKELRLWTGETSVSVRYGTDEEEERGRLLKHAHRRAIEKAWEEEKHYISLGLDGRRPWTEEEKDQLLSKGVVHGYRPSDLFSIHKYPHLADDPSNVLFQKDSRRKRRKSNKRRQLLPSSSSKS